VPAPLPDHVRTLFWDVDPGQVDVVRHADYVLERVMTRGGWEAMLWLRATYSVDDLAAFLRRKGNRLPARELAYWALIAKVDMPIPRGGGRPQWAGP
jgi:hypothetical protein